MKILLIVGLCSPTIYLQEIIRKISPEIFLERLRLFNLVTVEENEILNDAVMANEEQNSAALFQFTSVVLLKLYLQTTVYHERFKLFLGYYEDLQSLYLDWNSLCKILTL